TAGQSPGRHANHWVTKGGERRWIVWAHTALTGPDGRVELVVGTGTDETERRRAEEALVEADRRKDEFLAMLAHELRNPLAPLRNAVHLLQQPGVDRPLIDRTGEMVGRQVQQLARLVDDLLDLSRIARGKMQLRKEWLDLGDVVRQAVEASRPLLDARRHELT